MGNEWRHTIDIEPDQRRLRELYDWHSFVGDGNYIMHGVLWELIGNSNKKERKKKSHIFTTNNSANNNTIYILGCVVCASQIGNDITHMHIPTMINFIKKILSQDGNNNSYKFSYVLQPNVLLSSKSIWCNPNSGVLHYRVGLNCSPCLLLTC